MFVTGHGTLHNVNLIRKIERRKYLHYNLELKTNSF